MKTGSKNIWSVREVSHSDLTGLKTVIDSSGLFPSSMLDVMLAPYLEGNSARELWVTVEDKSHHLAVGYCSPERMTDGTWNMLLLAVHHDWQGRGIGSSIMKKVELMLRERGARLLIVETSGTDDFINTRAFYRAIGYQLEACIRDFYQAGDDKIVFRKPLAFTVRFARSEDIEHLQAIEIDAAQAYDAYPETRFCVNLPPRDENEHKQAMTNGVSIVGEVNGKLVCFLLAIPKDGRAHLLELAVKKDSQRQGFGRILINAFERWAINKGLFEATLTTYRDVAWNAPFYERLGFVQMEISHEQPELLAIIEEERLAGFHGAPRIVMLKKLVQKQ